MKTTLPLALALTGSALAQSSVTQSSPFKLIAVSDNYAINGLTFNACHSGAAIETLCTVKADTPSSFYFNVTSYTGSTTPTPPGGETGLLGYNLQANTGFISESMHLTVDIATNVGIPAFYPGNSTFTSVAFDGNDYLNLQSYVDDTVTPPNGTAGPKSYYRWYVCTTYFGSYTYQTLAWVYGNQPPQNPSCIKTDVKRVFSY